MSKEMFGCDIDQFKEYVESSFMFKHVGPTSVVSSLLSDAQEQMSLGMQEQARQTINRAKWVISEYLEPERE